MRARNRVLVILYLILFSLIYIGRIYSQDNCNSAVSLTVNPDESCAVTTYVTGYSTNSGVQPYGCQIDHDMASWIDDWWGKFVATSEYTGVRFSGHDDYHDSGILIYSGPCGANMNLIECSIFIGSFDMPVEAIAPTTPGETYYVRIMDPPGPNPQVCVFEFPAPDLTPVESCGNNLDFELADFTNWSGATGYCCPITMTNNNIQSQGINAALHFGYIDPEPSQHTITRGLNRDPCTDLNVPIVCPNTGVYSLRLGNAAYDSHAECIERTFTITEDNAGFTYYYAAVFEEPDHPYEAQPRFKIEVIDENGGLVPCAQYEVVSGFGTGTWETTYEGNDLIVYKDWVPVGLDLTPYIGTDITLTACVGDCDYSAHFGYAYFDIVCKPLEPMGFLVCTTGEPVELCAPEGYVEWEWSNGETTECITVDDPQSGDIYCVTVTNVVGCTSVLCDTVELVQGEAWGDTTICPGETVTIYSDANVTPAEIYWIGDPGGYYSTEQNPSFTLDDVGTYTFIVTMLTEWEECTIIDTVTVIVVPCDYGVEANAYPICEGDCSELTAQVTEGEYPPFTYVWDNGFPGEGPHEVCPTETTIYSVTVTDAQGQTATDTAIVIVYPLPVVDIIPTHVTCYGYCDGQALANVTIGTPPFTYQWDAGTGNQANNPATNLCPGTYSVTVTDVNGCTGEASVTINEPPELLLTISVVDAQCNESDGSAIVSATGGTPSYTYLWDAAAGNQTTATAVNLPAGIYSVTVTDANGCTAEITAIINTTDGPVLNITGTDVTCYGYFDGTIDLTVTEGTPPMTYIWSNGANTEDQSGLGAGNYTVTVTDAMGCISMISIILTEPPELVTSLTGTNIQCFGGVDGMIDLEVTGGTPEYGYLWSPGGEVTEDLNGIPAGQYDVTVTDANQCTAVNTIILTEPPELASVIANTDQLCTGDEIGTVDIEVSGGTPPYTYFWQPTDETTQDIDSLPSGEYDVLITDANGCTATNSIIIDEPYPILTQTIGTDVLCYGYTDGTAGVTVSGGTQPYTYLWNTGADTENISNIGAGTYTVTITDQNNCTVTDNIIINEPPELKVNIPVPDWICIGESVTLFANASGGTPGYNYIWNNGTMQQSNNVAPQVTTAYSVSATDINGCQATASATVNVYGPLAIDAFPDDTICPGESSVIYANYAGGMGEPFTVTINGIEAEVPYTVSPSITTTYLVCVNDECGTPEECDEVEVVVMDLPPVDFVADIYEGCEPLTVHFNETNEHEGQTYQWNFGDQWGSTYGNGKYPVHIFENPGVYDVSCTVTDVHGCVNTWTWYEMIHVWANPVAAFFPYPQVATILEPYIYFENNSSTYWYSHWDFGDGDESMATHPQHKYDTWGTYIVELAVSTEHGCVDTTWSEIIIQDIITFYAPTAFTPDFDDMNGLFSPVGYGIDPDNWHLMIYDRWGEKVWETYIYDVDEETGKVNHGWDGRIRGRETGESAVYTWLVVYKDITGAEHERAGIFTLIR